MSYTQLLYHAVVRTYKSEHTLPPMNAENSSTKKYGELLKTRVVNYIVLTLWATMPIYCSQCPQLLLFLILWKQ